MRLTGQVRLQGQRLPLGLTCSPRLHGDQAEESVLLRAPRPCLALPKGPALLSCSKKHKMTLDDSLDSPAKENCVTFSRSCPESQEPATLTSFLCAQLYEQRDQKEEAYVEQTSPTPEGLSVQRALSVCCDT
ncbi:Abnormal Spindle-Like Microcephaly-Associated Protein [Manis pentadactyla]|nr:Abnormal Spindle-Like Microcephaly-Associated Protein [Manis pentadactyla]